MPVLSLKRKGRTKFSATGQPQLSPAADSGYRLSLGVIAVLGGQWARKRPSSPAPALTHQAYADTLEVWPPPPLLLILASQANPDPLSSLLRLLVTTQPHLGFLLGSGRRVTPDQPQPQRQQEQDVAGGMGSDRKGQTQAPTCAAGHS